MRVTERLRGLDRRAETFGKRFQRQYDIEPPVWMKYAWLLVLLGPLTFPLSVITSPVVSIVVLSVVLVAYCAVAFRWVSKHRL
jgi:hypothetical protein